ncbi:hypothetical protein MD484_g974, partial [Candolleomyces efflorescens]
MWSSFVAFSFGIGFFLLAKTFVSRKKRNPRGLPLPPGPKGLPILGNVFQFPQGHSWEGYKKLSDQYGDMIYLTAPGNGILILGTRKCAVDLLDRRSAIYSDRPLLPAAELLVMQFSPQSLLILMCFLNMARMGFTWNFGLLSYGALWKQHNRAFNKHFGSNVLSKHHPIMLQETKEFLQKVNLDPNDIFEDITHLFDAELMRATYGFDDLQKNKALIRNARSLITGSAKALLPGRYLVNTFPFLKYIPSWFPGAGFQRDFRELAHMSRTTIYPPFEEAKTKFTQEVNGGHPCMAAGLIGGLPRQSDDNYVASETVARNVCGMTFAAGSDTTVSSATALLYALANYPEVQAKAQAEIDAVVGGDRLPSILDREHLPYVHALIKEVGRWHSVVPLGVAHANAKDDEYDGYFIPKGTLIIQNVWAIMHDPKAFDKPFEFSPERYIKDGKIDPSVLDPEAAAFGYGRRICPGRHFSNDGLFLMAASLLATFDITAPRDANGNAIPMNLEETSSTISKPLPFKCNITLRQGREHLLD